MKPALTIPFCWLMISFSLHAQVVGKAPSTGNFVLVEERVKTVSSIEYRSTVVVVVPMDTLLPVPVRLIRRPAITVILPKPDWPEPEPFIDVEPGPYFIFSGFPQQSGRLAPDHPWRRFNRGPNHQTHPDR